MPDDGHDDGAVHGTLDEAKDQGPSSRLPPTRQQRRMRAGPVVMSAVVQSRSWSAGSWGCGFADEPHC